MGEVNELNSNFNIKKNDEIVLDAQIPVSENIPKTDDNLEKKKKEHDNQSQLKDVTLVKPIELNKINSENNDRDMGYLDDQNQISARDKVNKIQIEIDGILKYIFL